MTWLLLSLFWIFIQDLDFGISFAMGNFWEGNKFILNGINNSFSLMVRGYFKNTKKSETLVINNKKKAIIKTIHSFYFQKIFKNTKVFLRF